MLAPCWYMPLCGDVKKWIALLILIPVSSLAGQVPPEAPWSGYKPIPNVPNPGYLKTETDPVYGVAITRISDEAAFGASGAAIQHQYAKVQAWNSDMTLLWLGFNKILRASDYTLFKSLDIPMKDGRWANTEPNIRYFCDGEHFRKVDVMNGKVTSLHRFPGFGSCTIGPWEGNISADDRYVVITSQDEKQAAIYDIKNGVVLGEKSFPRTFDWASVTPWGDFVVVNDRRTEDTRLYDLQFNFVRVLSDRRAHADFAVDTGGNKVFVEMCPLGMVRMKSGESVDLLPATTHTSGTCGQKTNNPWICGHVSGRAFDMPGWVLISAGTDDCNNGYPSYYSRTEMFYLKLDGSGTIRPLGFSRSTYSTYESQAKAVVSPDGSRVLFTSDWNIDGKGGTARDYVVGVQKLSAPSRPAGLRLINQ